MYSPLPSKRAFVPFVSVANMMCLVHQIGIETALSELTEIIEANFHRWQAFDKTPRVATHSGEGVIELMPTSDGEIYSCKYVNGHPKNMAQGLQTVTAFGLLAEVSTGYPVLLAEMTLLTALRTAATSAMAARHLAPRGNRTMAMIGNGAQAEFQALAIKAAVGIDHVGFGSDFLGIPAGSVFAGYEALPDLAATLRTTGFSDADVGKILGGNYARVFAATFG